MTPVPSASRRLARFVTGLELEDVPESTRVKVGQCVLDWLGGAWNASGSELAARYRRVATSLGQTEGANSLCSMVGSAERTSLPWAVFANAAVGHISETDDGHRASIMHPGTVVIPSVCAVAERDELSGASLLEAIVCGYEVGLRVGEVLGDAHYQHFHTTSTAGAFAAAASVSKAIGLSEDRLVWALGHAGTQASGLWQFLEEEIVPAKPFHPAQAALAGTLAAHLADSGVPGAEEILEGDKGLLRMLPSSGTTLTTLDELGHRFKVDEVNFKAYPTCGHSHSAIDALRSLLETHSVKPGDVDRIEVDLYRQAIEVAGKREPRTLAAARFSIPFCIAFVLERGSITFDNLAEDAIESRTIRALMSRVVLVHNPSLDAQFPASRPCALRIVLQSGETLETRNRFRRGDPERPLSDRELESKFRELAGDVLSPDQQRRIVSWCLELETAPGIEPFLFHEQTN